MERRRVLDSAQAQPLGIRSRCVTTSIPSLEQRPYRLGGARTPTHFDEQAGDIANHVMQKGVRGHIDVHEVVLAVYLQQIESPDG